MNSRQIATRDEVRRFLRENTNPPERSLGKTIAKIGLAAVLVTGLAAVTSYGVFSRKAPVSIMVNGSTAIKQDGFCAVKCKEKGAFHSEDIVYVENYSGKNKYDKKFYDRNENLLMEGVGNDTERWFFNPSYDGTPRLARAQWLGEDWYGIEFYSGEKAVRKWMEVKTKY